jgi:hypothetical protein
VAGGVKCLLPSNLIKKKAMAEVLIPTIIQIAIAISTTSPEPSSAIEVATRNHRFWFIIYLVWIVTAALVSAMFTGMLWRAGNRQQDSVIAETNERTTKLGKELADARTRQAEAEKKLLEVQERVRPRALSESEIARLRERLSAIKCSLPIVILTPQHRFPATDVAELFAKQVAELLTALKWNCSVEEGHGTFPLFGIRIEGFSNEHPIPEVNELAGAFANVTFAATHTQTDPNTPTKLLRIVIGQNPMEGRPQ